MADALRSTVTFLKTIAKSPSEFENFLNEIETFCSWYLNIDSWGY